MKNAPISIAILVLPESSASTVYGMYDIFRSPNADWEKSVRVCQGKERISPILVSRDGAPIRVRNGIQIVPDTSLAECPEVDVICIPEVMAAPEEPARGQFSEEAKWLKGRCNDGAIVAASCSGPMLLAEAGLLDGYEATGHWAWCDLMRRRYPRITVHEQRALVISGNAQRLIMAGSGTSWTDLALYVMARKVGVDIAMQVARMWLVDWHSIGQQPFGYLSRAGQVEDATVAQCQLWIGENYACPNPVSAMIQLSGLPERTFKRRFKLATGMSPLEYVHTLRLEEAKQLLEASEASLETVASEVGYADTGFFNRLFKRKVNLTPAQYRKRFSSSRKSWASLVKSAVA